MAKKRFMNFTKKTKWRDALQNWHSRLADNRGDRAALRKCTSLTQVVFVPAYHDLYQDISTIGRAAAEAGGTKGMGTRLESRIRERLPIIASLCAMVDPREKYDGGIEAGKPPISLPRQMGTMRSSGGGPVVSDLRFRRLIKCRTPEELHPALRRVVGLLESQKLRADIMSLAQSVFYWDEDIRKQWAYDYYTAESQHTNESE